MEGFLWVIPLHYGLRRRAGAFVELEAVLADNARPEDPLDLLVNQIPNFKGAVPPAGELY